MPSATITSRGRVTLPKSVRTALGLSAGDRLAFVRGDEGFILAPAPRKPACGMFRHRRARPATLAEIKAAIGEMGSESVE